MYGLYSAVQREGSRSVSPVTFTHAFPSFADKPRCRFDLAVYFVGVFIKKGLLRWFCNRFLSFHGFIMGAGQLNDVIE